MPRYLRPDLTIDHVAIAEAARKAADHVMARRTPDSTTTWQRAYDEASARYLDLAKGYRESEIWHLERLAEDVRRSAMDPRERRILELRETAHLGRMIDDSKEAIAVQEAAERELAALMAEAA